MDTTLLRRVADGILQQTTRRLIDHSTGQTYIDSVGLPPKPEISIESKFNAWFYQTWLLADGMRRAAAALEEPRYGQYGERNLEFIFHHLAFFEAQRAAGMQAAPAGDGALSPIALYFGLTSLWTTGLAPLVEERYAATKDARYEPYLKRLTKFLAANPRFEDGTLYRPGKGLMTDDAYMTVPFLVRQWQTTGEAAPLEDAVKQVLGTHSRLLDSEHGLLKHLWDLKIRQPSGQFWGRGNGWMVLAEVELLGAMPANHPRRAEVLAAYVRHMEGLRRCADISGGWHQVLDHPESWIETSATGMITCGIARGVNEGWLDSSYRDVARKGWNALEKKVTNHGDLIDVCGSTDTGDLAFYLNRKRLQGDLHGFGSFLLAGAEIVRLEKNSEKASP